MSSESAYLKIFVVNNGVWIIFLLPWIMLCNLYIFPVHFHLFVDIFNLITYKPADVNENNNQQNLNNPLISVWMKNIMIKRKRKIQFINKQQFWIQFIKLQIQKNIDEKKAPREHNHGLSVIIIINVLLCIFLQYIWCVKSPSLL